MLGAFAIAIFAVSVAEGHFPFIVAEEKGESAKVIFSDQLEPDTNVNIEKLAGTKLALRDAKGKDTPLDWKKGEACYIVAIPGGGNRVVYGVTNYGVLQKGEDKPFMLIYYPKAILGDATAKEATIGEKLPLEIVAVGSPGKTRFQVLVAGKPAANIEVTVMLPGDAGQKPATTDKEGMTPAFEATGRYGVYARHIEMKSGDFGGKQYDAVRSYATLVCDVGK
jgi:hypothetical protein